MLMAYADGRLDPVSREVVEATLRDRPEYRAKVEKFRQTLMPGLARIWRCANIGASSEI
jgi:anti-sigma factor RsiW